MTQTSPCSSGRWEYHPGWGPSPSGNSLWPCLILTSLTKTFFWHPFDKDVLSFPVPVWFFQRISWMSVIIFVSFSRHLLKWIIVISSSIQISTSENPLDVKRTCWRNTESCQSNAFLFHTTLWVTLEKPWMLCQALELLFSHLTNETASALTLCRIFRQSVVNTRGLRQAGYRTVWADPPYPFC